MKSNKSVKCRNQICKSYIYFFLRSIIIAIHC